MKAHTPTKTASLAYELDSIVKKYVAMDCREFDLSALKKEVDLLLKNFTNVAPELVEDLRSSLNRQSLNHVEILVWQICIDQLVAINSLTQSSETEEESGEQEDSEEEASEEDCGDEDLESIPRSGWMKTCCEISRLETHLDKLRSLPFIGNLFQVQALIVSLKAGFKKMLELIVRFIRFITFADAIDNFAAWVKENHSHRKAVIEFATLVDALIRIIAWIIFLVGALLRPDRYIRKMLPEEIEEHLPADP